MLEQPSLSRYFFSLNMTGGFKISVLCCLSHLDFDCEIGYLSELQRQLKQTEAAIIEIEKKCSFLDGEIPEASLEQAHQ